MYRIFPIAVIAILLLAMTPICIHAAGRHSPGQDSEPDAKPDTVFSGNITAPAAFLRIPQQDLDILPSSVRHDMYDYMLSDSIARMRNIYAGLSWIEKMTDNYMKVHLTDASDLQIKILPARKGAPLVMTVYTVCADSLTADSTVKFYDNEMRSLPSGKYMKLLKPEEYFSIPPGSEVSLRDFLDEMPFYTVAYTASEESDNLVGRPTVCDWMSREQRKAVEPYLRKSILWKWNGKGFSLSPQ